MTQTMLTGFTKKAISLGQYNRKHGMHSWNNLVYDWDVEFTGYQRADDERLQGYIKFHVIAEIVEALVNTRDKKTYKKTKVPGYKLTITQNMALPEHVWESLIVYEENFMKNQISKLLRGRERERGIKTKMCVKLAAKMLVIAWTLMKKREPFDPVYLNIE